MSRTARPLGRQPARQSARHPSTRAIVEQIHERFLPTAAPQPREVATAVDTAAPLLDRFAGYRDDLLRPVDGEWKIARRTIVLDSNVILAKNLSVFF